MTIISLMLGAIFIPAISAALVLAIGNRLRWAREILSMLAVLANLGVAIALFGREASGVMPWAGCGLEFLLRIYQFSGFILLATAGFAVAITLYCTVFLAAHRHANAFYFCLLISVAMANGMVLADNLILLLFFWEGFLLTTFGMIAVGRPEAYRTAVKALVIVGIADILLMIGMAAAGHLAGTFTMSQIHLPLNTPVAAAAFILMMLGAIAKGGALPFHTWIPDAAIDAPLPFMALFPAALEKLLGIYALTRITLDLFELMPASWLSHLLMIIGAVTILVAVMMALIQKDYKRLLAYHAISQVGYMILGIGTATPVGIVGGLFHMLNNALYKSALFLSGGAVEKQAGTTDLNRLGGLAAKMPVTGLCFVITAAAISGVPPFNGFFSKELVYDGALKQGMIGMIYYAAALLGSFLTAASFLKLGHSAYFGPLAPEHQAVKEAPVVMLIPLVVIAGICVLFGVYNALPLRLLIQPILGDKLAGHDFAGWPHSPMLVILTGVVLILALLNHLYGVRKSGCGLGAVDHIHHAPVLAPIYAGAEKRMFDPYNLGLRLTRGLAVLAWAADRFINWLSDSLAVNVTLAWTRWVRAKHTGNYSTYLAWSLIGALLIAAFMLYHR